MKLYIIYEKKVVSDSGGNPRSFERRQAAHNFIRTHQLFGAEITTDIEGISGRHRVNPKNVPRGWRK
jgi:hypothetical protein